MKALLWISAVIAFELAAANVNGQQVGNNSVEPTSIPGVFRISRGTNEYGIAGSASFVPVTLGGLHADEAKGRKLFVVYLHYARAISGGPRLSIQYVIEFLPLIVATHNIITTPSAPRATAYGFGLVPLGLTLNLRNSHRVKPFVNVGAGGARFNRPVPLADAGRFAFILKGGAGVRFFKVNGRAVSLGIELIHFSNGNLSGSNRGLNQIAFSTGFSLTR